MASIDSSKLIVGVVCGMAPVDMVPLGDATLVRMMHDAMSAKVGLSGAELYDFKIFLQQSKSDFVNSVSICITSHASVLILNCHMRTEPPALLLANNNESRSKALIHCRLSEEFAMHAAHNQRPAADSEERPAVRNSLRRQTPEAIARVLYPSIPAVVCTTRMVHPMEVASFCGGFVAALLTKSPNEIHRAFFEGLARLQLNYDTNDTQAFKLLLEMKTEESHLSDPRSSSDVKAVRLPSVLLDSPFAPPADTASLEQLRQLRRSENRLEQSFRFSGEPGLEVEYDSSTRLQSLDRLGCGWNSRSGSWAVGLLLWRSIQRR